MGRQTVSVDSGEGDSHDENAEIESEEVSEEEVSEDADEEEPSEEEPEEEEPDEEGSEEEEHNEGSCEEPNEENFGELEFDEVASCEVEPDEDSSEEVATDQVSHKKEPSELNSCRSPSGEARKRVQIDETCEEELYKEKEEWEEEPTEESAEEVEDEGEACELDQVTEPCEEHQEPCDEELDEVTISDEEVEVVEVEEEEEEVEVEEIEEEEEEPCEEPDEEPYEELEEEVSSEEPEGEPYVEESVKDLKGEAISINQTAMFYSGTNISSDSVAATKSVPELFGEQNLSSNIIAPQNMDSGVTRKKRRSKWDVKDKATELKEDSGDRSSKKRKSRWSKWSNEDSQGKIVSLPLKLPDVAIVSEVPKLLAQLHDITSRLQSGVVDDRPERERSPSPPPIYNNLGFKINTREARFRGKLRKERQKIITELLKKDPKFTPPPDYRGSRLQKRIYIPYKEHPDYNFIGLILGPSGNTQKRMEKETGARILLRGKGCTKEGKVPHHGKDAVDEDDLHVLIEADDQYSLDAAVAMVEKLLIPVDDGHNSHKFAQLQELAEMKGTTLRGGTSNIRKSNPCDICGDANHPASACPLTAPTPEAANSDVHHMVNLFHAAQSPYSAAPPPTGNSISHTDNEMKKKIVDESNLYVGSIPFSLDENKLFELFSPCGPISEAKVIRDKKKGFSKGYGFVKYADKVHAARAVAQMNGYKIDGQTLAVRVAGILPPPPPPHPPLHQFNPDPMFWPGPPEPKLPEGPATGSIPYSSSIQADTRRFGQSSIPFDGKMLAVQVAGILPPPPTPPVQVNTGKGGLLGLPNYPGPAVAVQNNPDPTYWPGPPESKLPEVLAIGSFPYSKSMQADTRVFSQSSVPPLGALADLDTESSSELARFPGYVMSLDPPAQLFDQSKMSSSLSSSDDYFSSLSSSSAKYYFTQNYGSYGMPPH